MSKQLGNYSRLSAEIVGMAVSSVLNPIEINIL